MTNRNKAIALLGGLVVGTAGVAVLSVVKWSLLPIGVWVAAASVIGNQTMNIERMRTGKLQPVRITHQHFDGSQVVAIKRDEVKKSS